MLLGNYFQLRNRVLLPFGQPKEAAAKAVGVQESTDSKKKAAKFSVYEDILRKDDTAVSSTKF